VFSTIRDWVLKLGYYKLTAIKESGSWVFIMDTSIQMGSMKCLLILGVRIDKPLKNGDYKISYCDVEPIILKPVESCPGEIVEEALREAEKQIGGPPIAVLSDQASELKRGVRLYNQDKVIKIIHVFDISHKLDLLLEKEFDNDEVWKSFMSLANQTMQQLKLTNFSHLAPPKQRQKNRLLAEFDTVTWGSKLLEFFNQYGNTMPKEHQNKICWITNYAFALAKYNQISIIGRKAVEHVRERGYYKGCCEDFTEYFSGKSMQDVQDFFLKICKLIEEEETKVPEKIHIPGSSEVIESTFGKFKQLEKANATGGLTSLLLSIPAFLGEMSEEIVAIAMESTQIDTVWGWVKEKLGDTFWSRKRRDLRLQTSVTKTSSSQNGVEESCNLESDEKLLLA